MTIKAIIFDMDGVLIDAQEWHYEALNRALGLFGYSISRYDHLVVYDGLPTRKKLDMLTLERGLPSGLHEFINDMKQQFTIESVQQNCRPQFHLEYALSRLASEGYRLAVASNSVNQTIELMLGQANLLQYFDFFLSNEDVSRPKPDPEIYVTAIQRLGLTPSECLVVEDNAHGIKAARRSGAAVMVVQGTNDVHYENILTRLQAAPLSEVAQ